MQQNNFFNRMRRAFTLTILIPVIVLIGLYSYILFVSNEKRLRDVCSNQTQMVATHINGLVSHMDFITMDLISHIDFLDSIKQFYFDSKATAQKYIEIADNMVPYKYFQTIYEITYLEERGYYCSTSIPIREYYKVHQIPTEPFLSSAWYRKSLAAKGAPVFVNIGPEGTDRSEGSMFALARSVTVPQRTIGCLYVQVDLSKNNDVLEPLYDYGATWAVYASDGTRLCCDDQYPDIQLDLQSYGEESTQIVKNAGAEKYMVSVSAGENGNFYVAAVYPLRLMWQEPVWNLLPYLVLTVIILAVAFYFIDRYSKLLSDPLSQLADMMQKTTLDNLKQPHHFYTENLPDEIISLYQSYSVMSDRITDMVQDKINWMKKMAEQRYRYLQYQINPHFLYNTLNVIGIMGEEAGQRSVFEACKTLTHLLRYSLVDFMKPSTFQEEFSSIHAYLNLMKLRFEHKVSYDIVYDQGLDRYCLPRFSIQPFVENVFEHAFDDEHGQVTILIRGEIRDDRWVITIRDNGKGFDSVKADRIQAYIVRYMEHMKDSDIQFQSEDGIGIINTVTRLMVYFRQDFSYGILSNPEGGCTIELSGALKWKEQA